ncbi:Fe-S cluster assembly protein SufD [Blattabacterium cuenoti]|uniref:Fe-S cluster assembly protein SufD n=1 Tax=Blattabacterium cuenoti TaxID=1653831 RepID=UPI00163C8D38|nr:Fe-S cluster assembly protein SufD [Blattabacterium cuenoti]
MILRDQINFLIKKIIQKNNYDLSSIKKENIDLYIKKGLNFSSKESPFIKNWNEKNIYSIFNKNYNLLFENFKQKKIYDINHIEKKLDLFYLTKKSFLFVFLNGKYIDLYHQKYINIKKLLSNKIHNFYGKLCHKKYDVFCSLNTIFSKNGMYIEVPDNTFLKKPIEILHIFTNKKNTIFNPRVLIIVGKNSYVKIIEHYKCYDKNPNFINLVNEIYSLDFSKIDYYKIQDKINNLSVIDNTFFNQKKNSRCNIFTFSLKGKIIKNNLNIISNGKKSKSCLYGLSISSNNESINHSTFINHKYSYSKSFQLYKSIFFKKSNGIFNGNIKINKNIEEINAFQKNNNILMSKESKIYAKPQLKIFSKNVKCSHGCTIGNIKKSELLYLKSRGISEKNSKILLLFSFFNEIIKKMDIKIGNYICNNISKKLEKFL